MSVFRVEKNNNFTIMSNYHLRDKRLSNKAKGQLKGCDYTIHEIPVEKSDSAKPIQEKPTREKPTQGNPRQSNTDILSTDILNTYSTNNQSISLDAADRTEVEKVVAEQIEAELLSFDCPKEQQKRGDIKSPLTHLSIQLKRQVLRPKDHSQNRKAHLLNRN